MTGFCPRCGAETDGVGSRGLCQDCYADEHTLLQLPDELVVERCEHCGAVRVGPDWVAAETDRDVIYAVLDHEIDDDGAVRAVRFEETDDGYHVGVIVERTVDGATVQDEVETWLVVEEAQCETCSKFHGGYYEYILQLRGDEAEEALGVAMDRASAVTAENRDDFVSDVAERDGGFDVYVSSRDMAEEVLKVLRAEYDVDTERSRELVGEEDGQRVYRTVVAVRL